MEAHKNKTIICSVFFLDIVEYSKKSVAEQIKLKERFNAFLALAIQGVPAEDRIILDTGDGAAITFIGDVEAALQAALSMRKSLLGETALVNQAQLLVRMGINLGPVRLVADLNGQPNVVGDGINVAQRVMAFADAGQVLVSRSYYDAVSRLSHEYAGLFHYQGSKTDKHVREHEVYAIDFPGEMTGLQASSEQKKNVFRQLGGALQAQLAASQAWLLAWLAKPEGRRQASIGGAGLAIVGLAVYFFTQTAQEQTVASASTPQPASTVMPASTVAQAKPESAAANTPPEKPSKPAEKTPAPIKEVKPAALATKESGKKPSEKVVKPQSAPTGIVNFSVKPWGEVIIDGNARGVSPPVSEITLPEGTHDIILRNNAFPEFHQKIDLKAGETLTVKHRF